MVTCTAQNDEAVASDLDQVLSAAASAWALVEVSECFPATPDTRERLDGARRALNRHLEALGWNEEHLQEHLATEAGRPLRPFDHEAVPPDG